MRRVYQQIIASHSCRYWQPCNVLIGQMEWAEHMHRALHVHNMHGAN